MLRKVNHQKNWYKVTKSYLRKRRVKASLRRLKTGASRLRNGNPYRRIPGPPSWGLRRWACYSSLGKKLKSKKSSTDASESGRENSETNWHTKSEFEYRNMEHTRTKWKRKICVRRTNAIQNGHSGPYGNKEKRNRE